MTEPVSGPAPLVLSNEFAEVHIRRVVHGLGTRLEIVAPRSGRTTYVDPVVLEGLTALSSDHLTAIVVAGVPGNDDGLQPQPGGTSIGGLPPVVDSDGTR